MKSSVPKILVGALLLLTTWSAVGEAAAGRGAKRTSQEVDFRDADSRAQSIARKLLGNEITQDVSSGANSLSTAWVNVSNGEPPELFVMFGCSPTGNCGLYGFEPKKNGWKLVLNSDAQICTILPSSHGGRHDISAYMHGSATEGTLKTYWWRRNRYVRVSERELISKQ